MLNDYTDISQITGRSSSLDERGSLNCRSPTAEQRADRRQNGLRRAWPCANYDSSATIADLSSERQVHRRIICVAALRLDETERVHLVRDTIGPMHADLLTRALAPVPIAPVVKVLRWSKRHGPRSSENSYAPSLRRYANRSISRRRDASRRADEGLLDAFNVRVHFSKLPRLHPARKPRRCRYIAENRTAAAANFLVRATRPMFQ